MMMASRPSLRSPMPLNNNDFDQYINYDQIIIPSPTFAPASSGSKLLTAPTSIPSHNTTPIQASSTPFFAPPSHRYEAFSNHNGLPSGAIHETYNVNQAHQMNYGNVQGYYGGGMDSGYNMNAGEELDSGSGYGSYNNADNPFDFNDPMTQNWMNQSMGGIDTTLVDPLAIGGQESPQVQQPPKRAFPGMHQQAAQAKAEAEKKQKEEKEAQEAQRRKQAAANTNRPRTDDIIEAKIKQLVNGMRHNSVGSSNEDHAPTPTASGNAYGGRTKKDEEDMDEDERLLASEEGKKLTSKERRQLRNKVSARAFRSRRKEYIGQLEDEIKAKSEEADELRAKNRSLMEENSQLLNLTRSMIESPAFADYLKEVDASAEDSASILSGTTIKAEATPRTVSKDVNMTSGPVHGTQTQQQDAPFVGMTLLPEEPVDMSSYEFNNNILATMDTSLYDDTQVFAVTSLPEGPSIEDLRPKLNLDNKSEMVLPLPINDESKMEPTIIERLPFTGAPVISSESTDEPTGDAEDLDPAFALFEDCSSDAETSPVSEDQPIFGNIESEKAFGRIELIIEGESQGSSELTSASVERFQRLCATLEALSESVYSAMPPT